MIYTFSKTLDIIHDILKYSLILIHVNYIGQTMLDFSPRRGVLCIAHDTINQVNEKYKGFGGSSVEMYSLRDA